MTQGFIKLQRGPLLEELMKDGPAYMLLSLIAVRAWRGEGFNRRKLRPGEAWLGKADCGQYGMSEQTYRGAKERLTKYGLATFRGTNKGTIARLCDASVYDINVKTSNALGHMEATSQQRANNEPATPNKEGKEDKKVKKREGRARQPFVKPTEAEVATYCRERGNTVDAKKFWNHYEANGWVQGRSGKPIVNWKAAVHTWEGNGFDNTKNGHAVPVQETYKPKFLSVSDK